MNTQLIKKILMTASLNFLISISIFAGTISYDKDFTVNLAETKSIKLVEKSFIKNIIVQAEGIRKDSMIEVMVNGSVILRCNNCRRNVFY